MCRGTRVTVSRVLTSSSNQTVQYFAADGSRQQEAIFTWLPAEEPDTSPLWCLLVPVDPAPVPPQAACSNCSQQPGSGSSSSGLAGSPGEQWEEPTESEPLGTALKYCVTSKSSHQCVF